MKGKGVVVGAVMENDALPNRLIVHLKKLSEIVSPYMIFAMSIARTSAANPLPIDPPSPVERGAPLRVGSSGAFSV